jgi:REP element-mobilizing transposase RayT
MKHYERRLPHWDVVGLPLFVTFRLHDSLPAGLVFAPATLTTGKAFMAMDRILDRAATGPKHLRMPEIAAQVIAALRDGERRFNRYQLHSYVVMPNHVHLLVTPQVPATEWLGPLKGFTAHEANLVLSFTGKPFWQNESYDHLARSRDEFERIQRYIENNPVKAGLVAEPGDFLWSSARELVTGRTGSAAFP